MPSSDTSDGPVSPGAPPADLAPVGTYSNEKDAWEHGLVVLAMGHACWLVHEGAHYRLLVEPDTLPGANEQIARFDRESKNWPPAPDAGGTLPVRLDFTPALLWAGAILAVYWAQGARPELTSLGALDAEAVFGRGEWWRPFTALFLHADPDHILANLLTGIFIFTAVVSTLGRLRGVVLILAASLATNAALAVLSGAVPYRSIGASTAVFAALGLLAGRAIRVAMRSAHPHRLRTMFVPFAAALTTLALYGAGGQNVDLAAHAVGFATGLLSGLVLARMPKTS